MNTSGLEERLLIYNFLGSIYKQGVTADILNFMADKEAMDDLAEIIDNSLWKQGIRLLQQEISDKVQESCYLDELNEEYTELFIGPGHLEAPPWESVYLTREHLLFGEPTFKVRNFYHSFGIECSTGENEPDDHIGLELLFMAKLIEKTLANIAENKSIKKEIMGQKNFLEEHIMQWVPAFCNDLRKAAKHKFFYQLATITLGWLEAELVYLEGVLQDGTLSN